MLPLLSTTIYLLIRSLNGVDAHPVNMTITSHPISDICSSILAESVNATASSQRCGDIDNCRTLDGIVRSCLATILACAWFAVHRNIPAPEPMPSRDPDPPIGWRTVRRAVWRTVCNRMEPLMVFLVAFLAPEWVLGWALRQAFTAWRLSEQLEEARLQVIGARNGQKAMEDAAEIARKGYSIFYRLITRGKVTRHPDSSSMAPNHATCTKCERNTDQCQLAVDASRVGKGDGCWTWLHGFFVAMGGFHFYTKDGPQYPLSPANVLALVARGHLVPPTADEISDKSKGDWLSKGVAIVQTVWFVVQCIARRAEGLPITRLEVMTLAYTVITVGMYVVWWKKPLNVGCAVRVPEEDVKQEAVETYHSIWEKIGTYVIGLQDEYVDLRQRKGVPTFWAGMVDDDYLGFAVITAILVAMAFGAVHCIAWHSEFQSHREQELWRLSAISIIVAPPAFLVATAAASAIGNINAWHSRTVEGLLAGVLFTPIFIVYTAARLILIILSFTSLRGLPYTAYETVQWTTLIPHI